MNFPGRQPEKLPMDQEDAAQAAERRRRQDLLDAGTDELPHALSWGERLLPLLFAGMETCWIYAILLGLASVNFFQSGDPLIPVWAPFVLIVGSFWLVHYIERRAALEATQGSNEAGDQDAKEPKGASQASLMVPMQRRTASKLSSPLPEDQNGSKGGMMPGTWKFIAFAGLITLFLIWLHLYTQTAFVLDPSWLLALVNDILLFNLRTFQVLSIVGLTVYFCWRGIRLARRTLNASHIFNTMRIGLGVIIAVILLRTGQGNTGGAFQNEVMLLLLIPIFLFLSLAAHSLARVTFIRHSHPFGLVGSILEQESSLLLVLAPIGLILLLIAVLVGSFVNPAFLTGISPVLAPFGIALNWLAGILSRVVIFLLTPVIWLFSLIFSHLKPTHAKLPQPPQSAVPPSGIAPQAVVTIVTIIKIIVPILLILVIVLVLRWMFRHRRMRVAAKRRGMDVHESLWSWSLFWAQFKSLWSALFRRFLPKRAKEVEEQEAMQKIEGEPAARTIREIYRALLRKATQRGYPRKRHETPYEFQERLDELVPLAEPQLEEITSSYAAIRYGGVVPDETEVAHVRRVWNELNQKWVS